jgi:citrate lyase subunit beta/citryl-CoA lyase
VLEAYNIAVSSKRLVAIALGAEDYVSSLKTSRTADGVELMFARSMIVNAARAAGLMAIDTVYSDVNNEEGFRKEATLIKSLGFDGKSVINPRQIPPLHEIFTPTEKELEKAFAIIEAIKEAESRGSGVIALNGKMIDKPVVERAKLMIERYEAAHAVYEEV